MAAESFDPAAVLRVLHAHGVDFVIIGGLAVIAHGHLRATADVDIILRPERSNLESLAAALADLDAALAGVDAHLPGIELDAGTLAEGANFTLTTRFGELDVIQDVPGARAFEDLQRSAVATTLDDVPVRVVGLPDLLALKRASDRPRDREDVRVLEQLSDADC